MKRPAIRSRHRATPPPPGDRSIDLRLKRVLSRPQQVSWAQLVEAVNEPNAINPTAKYGPQDEEMGRFKMAVYAQVIRLLDSNKRSHIKAFNRFAGKYPTGLLAENPFHWVLFALSKSDQLDRKLHPAQVRQLGLQLNYAHKHRIPVEFLVGFLHQTGATGARKQVQIARHPEDREWWFDDYKANLTSPHE